MSKAVKPTRPRKAAAVSLRAGRPQGGHSADRRDRLLDTALDLFASQGIAATSLQAIAHEAQVTPALVHYYFGNKEQLLAAIIEERLMPLVQQFTSLLDMNSDEPLATILAITRGMADITAAHPWLSPLWVREVLSEGGLLRDWIQEHVAKGISEKISQLTRAAQQKNC